ncbi:acetyl-CoA hydrolase/transferase C-terminal domain-containing protein [Actinoplanes sp. NPDC049802]|uniref:acetyl-CoA hydrolase/transferase family protein n=1 Tax=Actinoplanes sp. NPDC049802 TaxID=3154742 RepID=UPI0033FCBD8F
MDWQSLYRARLTTAAEAVTRIKPGDRVVLGHAAGSPEVLVEAMVANAAAYRDVEIVHLLPMGPTAYCEPRYAANFRHNALFAGGPTRTAIEEGRADFTPVFFHQTPRLLRTSLPVDVAMVQVSPPDEHGYCSLGVSVDYTKPAAEAARLVIAQVNPNMPRTHGDSFLHVSRLDVVVETDVKLIELPRPPIGPVEAAIGRNCAELVHDGDTLQLGIGAIPDAVLAQLGGKKDLGIHSEMLSDGIVDLIEAGVVTNARKSINVGRCVVTFLMGSQRLYDFVDDNPLIQAAPVDYVNDPRVIAQNDNMVAINSCIQVDLSGQVVAGSVGPRQISGIGGQADFVRGATLSRGGRVIMAIPSTARGGKASKIVPFIEPGAAVSTMRCDTDYVVTEFGIAQLWGQTLKERARRLIAIAHPTFREDLAAEFQRRFASPLSAEENSCVSS